MRPHRRTDDVVGIINVGSPVADCLAGGILQGAGAGSDRHHLCPQQLHLENIQLLALNIYSPHENLALHAEQRRHRSSCHAMLACTCLCNYPVLAHALRQKGLPQGIVDLVGAGMEQILTLEINLCSAIMLGQLICIIQKRRPACILHIVLSQLCQKIRIILVFVICLLQLVQHRHNNLRHILSAILAKSTLTSHSLFPPMILHLQ